MFNLYVCPECGSWALVNIISDSFIKSSATATHLCLGCKSELYEVVESDRLQVTSKADALIEQPQ